MPRIVVVGAGFVGSTAAYAVLHRGLGEDLVLSDVDRARAEGEAMDLGHALAFLKNARVRAAALAELDSADLVVVAAGRSSKPGETRLDLVRDNASRMRSICAELRKWKRLPVVLVVSNPVDVLAEIVRRELDPAGTRVFGSGTTLDTARLKTELGAAFGLDPHSIHGYVLGEHGDSEFVAWSTVHAGGVGIRGWPGFDEAVLEKVFLRVRDAAYEIIKRKRATYFGVGAAVAVLAEAVLRDQHTVLPVSVSLGGRYGLADVSLSLPCVLGRVGIERVLAPELEPGEEAALRRSAEVLKKALEAASG